MEFAESQTSESGQSFGGVQAETEVTPSLRILRIHVTKRDGKISERLSGDHYKATYLANSTGRRILSSIGLCAQRCKT